MSVHMHSTDMKVLIKRNFEQEKKLNRNVVSLGNPLCGSAKASRTDADAFSVIDFSANFSDDLKLTGVTDVPHVSIHFQLEGKSGATINGIKGEQYLQQGTHNIYVCNEPQATLRFPHQRNYRYAALIIPPGVISSQQNYLNPDLENFAERFAAGESFSLFKTPRITGADRLRRLQSILHCSLPDDLAYGFLYGTIVNMLAEEVQEAGLHKQEDRSVLLSSNDVEKLALIREYVSSRFLESISLQQLSNMFEIPAHKIKKGFPAQYQQSFFSFQLMLRMQYAAAKLKQGSCNVTEIAYEVGYSNANGFIAAFKKIYNTTPKKYANG